MLIAEQFASIEETLEEFLDEFNDAGLELATVDASKKLSLGDENKLLETLDQRGLCPASGHADCNSNPGGELNPGGRAKLGGAGIWLVDKRRPGGGAEFGDWKRNSMFSWARRAFSCMASMSTDSS